MVVEESIASARLEEATVHRMVEDSFESLREDRVRAWLRAKKPEGKKAGHTVGCPQFPCSRFDEVSRIWMAAAARRKAAWEAASRYGTNPFADDAEASGSGQGGAADDAEASGTGNSNGSSNAGDDDILLISSDEE